MTSYPRTAYGRNILSQLAIENYDGHEKRSSEITTDDNLESGDSGIRKDDFLFGYVGEEAYKEEELKLMKFSDNESNND